MADPMICRIYRSPRKEGMYLFVPKASDLEAVPESLMKGFGKPEHAMDLMLKPNRKLARADVGEVLAALEEKGFYLQMPPRPDDDVLTRHRNPMDLV